MPSDIRKQLFETKMMSEVNMTSLMDITFLLLLVFIVTFPMLETGTSVKLPSGQGQAIKEGETVSVTLDAETRIFVDGNSLTLPELEETARRIKAERPDVTVLLRGDVSAPYGRIMEAMQALQRGGLGKIALANQPGPKPNPGDTPPAR